MIQCLPMISSLAKNLPTAHYIEVDPELVGQRLDNFLFTHLKGVPKTRIYRIIRKGEVRVNKGRIQPMYRLQSGDSIRIPPIRQSEEKPELTPLPDKTANELLSCILYEDNSLIILNKPCGIAVHGGSGLSYGVIEALRQLRPEIRGLELVHRLDRETSGCLMLAKNRKTLKALQLDLQQGSIEKVYIALVRGHWRGGDVVEAPLMKNQLASGERMVKVHPEGQWSRTEFKVIERFPIASLIEARPITGRTHQIRAHATYASNPIAGDPKYGDADFNKTIKSYGLKRLFLHAAKITLKLPETGELKTFEAPLELSLVNTLAELQKDKTV
jgi:23S rRNA pseudouridine955/2504/2580 synthase